MFDKLEVAQAWLFDQYSIVKTWSLDQILTIKLWMLITAILGTGLLSSLGTLSLIYAQQALQPPKTISDTVIPHPICPICPSCHNTSVQNPRPASKFWDYKPLPTKGGKTY